METYFLIRSYDRDKPIRSLSEFSYYLSLITDPKAILNVPEGRMANVIDVCESVRALPILSPKLMFGGSAK